MISCRPSCRRPFRRGTLVVPAVGPSVPFFFAVPVVALLLVAACSSHDHGPPRVIAPADLWDHLSPSGPRVADAVGMATQMYDGPEPTWERDFEIDRLLEAGLVRLRASIDWPDVEPANDDWQFENSDLFVARVTGAGLVFDGRLCYGVDWARPEGNDSAIRPEDFADYAGAVAERYCGTIESYEIWNEENHDRFWKPEPDPDAFGRMLKATYRAVHDACPGAKVVFGGLSCLDDDTFTEGLYYFLERVHDRHPDIGQYFDVLAIHPYTFLQQTPPEWSLSIDGREVWPDLPGQIRTARERLAAIGHASTPVWLTEYGWPSLLIGRPAQAAFLARGALLAIAEGAEALHVYTFWDRDGTSFPPTEDFFGLFTDPGAEGGPAEKPAYLALRALTGLLGRARFAGDLSTALGLPEGVFGLAFRQEGPDRWMFAGWDSRPGETTEIALPCPRNTRRSLGFGLEGETLFESGAGEAVNMRLTQRVLYVLFEGS